LVEQARQGKLGSGQIICMSPIKDIHLVKSIRNKCEAEVLDKFENIEAKIIDNKDWLFNNFCKTLKDVRENLKKEISERSVFTEGKNLKEILSSVPGRAANQGKKAVYQLFLGYIPSVYENMIISAIEERWGMFLKAIEEESYMDKKTIETKYKQFDSEIQKDLGDGNVIKNPYYHVCIANDELANGEYRKAEAHFNKAIELDKTFSASAHYGKAVISLLEGKNDKNKVLQEFNAAASSLKDEIESNMVIKSFYSKGSENVTQLAQRISVLETYLNNVLTAISVIKKSQRLIDLKIIGKDQTIYKNELEKVTALEQLTKNKSYEVTFNDLIAWYDSGERDEAKQTIAEGLKILPSNSELAILAPEIRATDVIMMLNPNIEFSGCYKQEAIDKLVKQKEIHKQQKTWSQSLCDFSSRMMHSKSSANNSAVVLKIRDSHTVTHCGLDSALAKDIVNAVDTCKGFRILQKNKSTDDVDKSALLNSSVTIQRASRINGQFDIEIESENLIYNFQDYDIAEKILRSINESADDSIKFDITFTNANKSLASIADTIIEVPRISQEVALQNIHSISPSTLQLEVYSDTKDELVKLIDNFNGSHIWLVRDQSQQKLAKDGAKLKLQAEDINTIKFEALGSDEAQKIVEAASNCIFSIDFTKFDKTNVLKSLNVESPVNLRFCRLEQQQSNTVIDYLRDQKQDFQLVYKGLNYKNAQAIIEKAQIKPEEIEITRTDALSDLFSVGNKPIEELSMLSKRGIDKVVHLQEKGHIQWRSILVVSALATAQIVAGIALVMTGVGGTAGLGLISEGAVDMYTAYRAYTTRQFSWKGYLQQKLISVAISIATAGYQAVKNAAQNTTSIGQRLAQQTITEVEEQGVNTILREGLREVGEQTIQTTGNKIYQATKNWICDVAELAGQNLTREVSVKTVIKNVAVQGITACTGAIVSQLLDNIKKHVKEIIAMKIAFRLQDSSLIPIIQKANALQTHENQQLRIQEANVDKIIQDIMKDRALSIPMQMLCGAISNSSESISIALTLARNIAEITTITDHLYKELDKRLTKINSSCLSIPSLICRGDHRIDAVAARAISEKLQSCIVDKNGCLKKGQDAIYAIDQIKLGEYDKHKVSITKTLAPLKKEVYFSDTVETIAEAATAHILNNVANIMTTSINMGTNALANKMFENDKPIEVQEKIAISAISAPIENYGLYSEDLPRIERFTRVSSPVDLEQGYNKDSCDIKPTPISISQDLSGMLSVMKSAMMEMNMQIPDHENEVVVVLGVTGAGKSTLINYLSSTAKLEVDNRGRINTVSQLVI
jgi:tetratricopeptide (TPR) repeat protein